MRLKAFVFFLLFTLFACHKDPQPAGTPLPNFPTTASTTKITNAEFYPPNIALAVNTLAASVSADLSTLNQITVGTNKVRCVITALPGGYTGTGTGVLTASAVGAITSGECGGVTLVAGDVAMLAGGATNVAGDAGVSGGLGGEPDTGPYTVTVSGAIVTDGGSTVKYVLTRPTWWSHGSTVPVGAEITVGGEDTLFAGSKWHTYAVKGAVVDTTDPSMFPDSVATQVALSSGVKAITTVPLRSASTSAAIPALVSTAGTVTTTVGYQPFAITPGYLGTTSVTVKAVAAGLTTNTLDTSTLNVHIVNP